MYNGKRINKFFHFATFVKEYWFLITLLISLFASILYMILFQVTPLDPYYEIKHKREQIEFHSNIGYSLLEQGNYELSKKEFERAINLNPTDYIALNGRYLSELFLDMESPDWDPAVGLAIQNKLGNLGIIKEKKLIHIVNKYFADFHYRIGQYDSAKIYYEKALNIKTNYLDALYSFGWFIYSNYPKMIEEIEKHARLMTEIDPYDYRGFHMLGYALYMGAINENSSEIRHDLIYKAAIQSEKAKNLKINRLNVIADFGEVARSVAPKLSIYFHELAYKMLDDSELMKLPANRGTLKTQLLMGTGSVNIETIDQKRAWINYQLAIDYMALSRIGSHSNRNKEEHDRLLKKAKKLDQKDITFPIYLDQLAILELILSNKDSSK